MEEGQLGDILEELGWMVGDVERKILRTKKKIKQERTHGKVEEEAGKRDKQREIEDLHKLRRAIGRARWFAERLVKKCLFLRVLLVSVESVRKRAVMVEMERRAEWMAFWYERYVERRWCRRGSVESDESEQDVEGDLRSRRCLEQYH